MPACALLTGGLGFGSPLVLDGLTVGQSFFAALRAYLKGVPALAALTDVYRNAPGQTRVENWPYLVMSPINAPMGDVTQTGAFAEPYEVQFTVVGPDDAQAEDLGKAAWRALSPYNGVTLAWNDGSETLREPRARGRLTLQPGRSAANENVWAYSFSYYIHMTGQL